MDLETFRELLSVGGQAALADAGALAPTEASFLAHFEKLRKAHPPALARAALETVLLRKRAGEKHPLADRFYFTRQSLEQSSSEAVSRYRARRLAPYRGILDLCGGAGMDSIYLAESGCRVWAIERDPVLAAMARANAEAAGLAGLVEVREGDVLEMALPPAEAAFVDPSRREKGRRFLAPNAYQPPLDAVLARFPANFPIAAKIAPGVARRDLEPFDAEAEFISLNGELKECVLWFGPLRTQQRRATLLPDGHTLAMDELLEEGPPTAISEYVYDPDAAVIRAGLLPLLAAELEAAPVDSGVALLTGPRKAATPFASPFRVEAVVKMSELRDALRKRNAGRATLMKRAVEVDVNEVQKRLNLTGSLHWTVILTQSLGRRVAIVAEKMP